MKKAESKPTPLLFVLSAATAATAVARRREDRCKRTVFIQTEKQGDNNGKSAAVKDVGTEEAVLRTEDEQSNENPKSGVAR